MCSTEIVKVTLTSAMSSKCVILYICRAQSVDPVSIIFIVLNHSTNVDLLKGTLIQESVGCSWKKPS